MDHSGYGFNSYADGDKLDADVWSGDINAEGVAITRTYLGDQKLVLSNTKSDVSVSTTISGLTVGENYVAEVYIANESDAKAALTVKAGESGRLFGTVKPADVAAAVEAAGLGSIDKRKVELPTHIKSVGSFQANVRLHDDVAAVIDLEVVAS